MARDPRHEAPRHPGSVGRTDGREHEPHAKAERPVGSLVKDLVDEGRRLLRDEVELARAETSEKVHRVTDNLTTMVVGAGILIAALLVLATAAVTGVVALFELFVPEGVAMWLGPLALGVLLAAIGYGMFKKGLTTIKHTDPVPRRAVHSTKETAAWAKDRM